MRFNNIFLLLCLSSSSSNKSGFCGDLLVRPAKRSILGLRGSPQRWFGDEWGDKLRLLNRRLGIDGLLPLLLHLLFNGSFARVEFLLLLLG